LTLENGQDLPLKKATKVNPLKIEDQTIYYHSSENMAELADESINLAVTSPPYGTIKDYDHEDQIGFSDDFDKYIARLSTVWKECYRVLQPGSRLVINIGDQFLRAKTHGRYRILPIGSRIIHSCVEIGFDYLGDIIWQKVSTTNTSGGCSLMGSLFYPRNGLMTYDYEHVLIFKKHGGKEKKPDLKTREKSKICIDEWKEWYTGHWNFPGIRQTGHVAMFPEELPYRIIRMFSFIGDIVLDPFAGSGTTFKVARALGRTGVGYEINPAFRELQESKIREGVPGLYRDFQLIARSLIERESRGSYTVCYDLQKRRGFIIIEMTATKRKFLVDMANTATVTAVDELQHQLEKKCMETHVNKVLESDEKALADNVVIVLKGPPGKVDVKGIQLRWSNLIIVSFSDFISAVNRDRLSKLLIPGGGKDKTAASRIITERKEINGPAANKTLNISDYFGK